MNEPSIPTQPKRKAKKLAVSLTAIIVAILVALPLIIPRIAAAKARAQRIGCVCREKQIGIAFRGFGIDMGGFPMQVPSTNASPASPTPK
jgi:hypothetical protein